MKNPIFFDIDDGQYSPMIHYFYIMDNGELLGKMEGRNTNELWLYYGFIYHAEICHYDDVNVIMQFKKLN